MRRLAGWSCAVLTLLLVADCSRERPGIPPEHVLLVTLADARADHTSAWLYHRPTTQVPRRDGGVSLDLDRLADEGVRFAAAFAPSPRTETSLLSLMSGCSARTWDRADHSRTVPRRTLVRLLKENGFATAAFVSSPFPLGPSHLLEGFDVVVEETDAVPLLERAVRWLRSEFDPDVKSFVWLHLGDTAAPWIAEPLPGEEGNENLLRRFMPVDADPSALEDGFLSAAREGSVEVTRAAERALQAAYDADLARTSRALRLFLEFYAYTDAEKHPLDRTLVVVAGTNGVELGERGWTEPEALLDATLHVPLVFHHPSSLTGKRILAEVVELSDVLPTICEWMGIDPPEEADGRTLLPLVDSYVRRGFPSRPALARDRRGGRSLRDARWRLVVRETGGEPAAALFDHRTDPLERHDHSDRHPLLVSRWLDRHRADR